MALTSLLHGRLHRVLHLAVATTAALLICFPLFSQTNQGRIQGAVFDQTGGAIAGATVTVTDVARGAARTLTTDSAGEYSAPNLLPSTYTVRAEARGFKAVEHTNVLVQVGEDIRVDLTVQPGEQTQTVTVTAEVPTVETTNATLGGAISNETINDLPLNGRDFTRLIQLRPGVVSYPGGGDHADSTNGQTANMGVYLLDGLLNYTPINGGGALNYRYQAGGSSTILPIDAIQEFNVQENPKAEYGWAIGAITNVGLKSGTNGIHGTAYAFGRDDAWDARNFFNPPTLSDGTPNPKTPVALKQFGATAGGPIRKDKLFWFVGYEGQRYTVGDEYVGAAPVSVSMTTLGRTADPASSIVDACLDLINNKKKSINALSAQLAGLNTTTCAVSPASSTVENLFPLNPGTNPGGATVFAPTLTNSSPSDNGIAKVDYRINDHNTLSGSYFNGNLHNAVWVTSPDQLTSQMQNLVSVRAYDAALSWIFAPNSTWVNEARIGANRITEVNLGADSNINQAAPWPGGFGINTGITNPLYYGMPYLQISSLANFALGHGNFSTTRGPGGLNQIIDNVSYLRGKHTFKFGGNFFQTILDDNSYNGAQGKIKFRDIENYLQGTPSQGSIVVGNTQYRKRDWDVAAFAQDDWRMTTRLTLNLGLRWEFASRLHDLNNFFGYFNPATGLVQGTNVKPDYRNFSPRIGFAWDVRGNGRTVVRSAFSVMYPTAIFSTVTGATGVPFGFDQKVKGVTTLGSQAGGGTVTYTAAQVTSGWNTTGPVFPATGRLTCGDGVAPDPAQCNAPFIDPNIRTPHILNWNLDIQRVLTNTLTLDLAYVGNHGWGLTGNLDINAPPLGAGWFGPSGAAATCLKSASDAVPFDKCGASTADEIAARPYNTAFPYLQFINELGNRDRSNYDGLQATVTERPLHGLYFLAGYTYSHALDQFSSPPPGRGGYQDPALPQLDYGSSDYDLRNRFTFSLTYNLPGKKSPGQMLQGWVVNSVVTLQTGMPWGTMDTNNDFYGNLEFKNSAQERWNFTGNPSDFTSGPSKIPCFSAVAGGQPVLAGCTPYAAGVPPAVCMNAAKANGALAVASLVNNGCYVKGNSAITPPAYGSVGTMGRNIFRDGGFKNWDLSVVKDWKFKERLTTEFRAEFFNILNHPNFANPYGSFTTYYNNDPSSGLGFGCGCLTPDAASGNFVLGPGGARDIQLGLKLIF
jgi:carboxypeptidase family protein/TonB-dependent receptor-like protein